MSAPSKVHNIQLVKTQPGEWIASIPEHHSARRLITVCYEAKGTEYWTAPPVCVPCIGRQVKGRAPESRMRGNLPSGSVRELMENPGVITPVGGGL